MGPRLGLASRASVASSLVSRARELGRRAAKRPLALFALERSFDGRGYAVHSSPGRPNQMPAKAASPRHFIEVLQVTATDQPSYA
jgi:hypothetical protein